MTEDWTTDEWTGPVGDHLSTYVTNTFIVVLKRTTILFSFVFLALDKTQETAFSRGIIYCVILYIM